MKGLFQCTDIIARIRVSPLVARTKKPCRFSHGRSRGRTIINPSPSPALLTSSRAASALVSHAPRQSASRQGRPGGRPSPLPPRLPKPWRRRSRPRGRKVAFPLNSPHEALGARWTAFGPPSHLSRSRNQIFSLGSRHERAEAQERHFRSVRRPFD
jgi:hypothetical protein